MKHVLHIFTVVLSVLFLSACGKVRENKNIIFDGKYPPVKTIVYTEDGTNYEIAAVVGHCLLFFSDETTQAQAQAAIERYGGKIIEQMPAFNYYLAQVAEGKENDFIAQMREEYSVEYVFLNTVNTFNSEVYILDNFKDVVPEMLTTHGNGVRRTFSKYSGNKNHVHNINREIMNNVSAETKTGQYWQAFKVLITANSLCTDLLNIAQNTDDNEITLINMSFGVPLQGKEHDLYRDVSEESRENYKKSYEKRLEKLAHCFNKMRGKGVSNFLVTKSSGNEGMYNLQNVINNLSNSNLRSLQKNMVLVNAYDTKTDVWHSNSTNAKHSLATTVDVTPEPWSGTSFAAPKLLGYIDKIQAKYTMLNAQDMLQAVRNATPQSPRQPLSYETLEREAKKIVDSKKQCKQFLFVLDMTSEYSGEWDLSDGNKQDIVKYRVHDTYSYDYLAGNKMAIYIDNQTNYDLEIFLNVLDADTEIRPMRYVLEKEQNESFYAYQIGTYDHISVRKLEIKLITW
ncbi:MAG: S8/S53 family peptidase [Planctomycetaceae bacterium]|jgi:hypothetical protein|nr:S8/S53 family peptidase [Planctomycetaceae bacterium]